MALKKRSRVTALFNMSSLTDIIFLLLIFFMLTSSLVAPNALNLKLPGQQQNKSVSERQLDRVRIENDCTFRFNGRQRSSTQLETALRSIARNEQNYSVLISYAERAPTECVVEIMDMARRLEINGVLASPKSK